MHVYTRQAKHQEGSAIDLSTPHYTGPSSIVLTSSFSFLIPGTFSFQSRGRVGDSLAARHTPIGLVRLLRLAIEVIRRMDNSLLDKRR
jgi:hypothetical protein